MNVTDRKFLRIVGIRVRKYRREKNFSQEQLAELCDLDTSTMIKIEAGNFNMRAETLICISNFLGVPVTDFIAV